MSAHAQECTGTCPSLSLIPMHSVQRRNEEGDEDDHGWGGKEEQEYSRLFLSVDMVKISETEISGRMEVCLYSLLQAYKPRDFGLLSYRATSNILLSSMAIITTREPLDG